ncbi:hypothetical protein ABIE66_004641 [Peribacillus sp. B2I2]|uniref:hypothetical protein n=1 Tax=Peribacillus sp. B2I2 TaxID=3156468 RepID=UPI0035134C66
MKKFATLMQNNWLAETTKVLAARRLGRQSAERERISEIKLALLSNCLQTETLFHSFRFCFEASVPPFHLLIRVEKNSK